MSRDLPRPGSPTIKTSWPSPARERPAASEQAQLLLAADERRERASAAPSAAATRTSNAEELGRSGNALEFVRALLLRDKEPGNLALDDSSDQDGSRFGSRLHPRSHIRCFTKHLPGRVDHDQTALKADASPQLRRALRRVSRVEVPERPLDGQCGPDGALGVVLLRLRVAEEGHQPVAEPFQDMPAKSRHRPAEAASR